MAEIIKFRKPQELSIEEEFIATLNEQQMEMFGVIILKASEEYERLINKYAEKCAELEMLKMRVKSCGIDTEKN